MSLVVATRRRTYVVLLSREGLTAVRSPTTPSRRIEHALTHASAACGARVVAFAPVHRRWGDSLFELSFSVIAPMAE
jgi:hypothetical protein